MSTKEMLACRAAKWNNTAQIRYVNEALDMGVIVRHHQPVIDIANSSTPSSDSMFHEERTKFIHILNLGKKLMYPNGIILQIIR